MDIKELEDKLNPSNPKNARAARWSQRAWENEQVLKRILFWRFFFFILFIALPPSIAIALGVVTLFNLAENWGPPIIMLNFFLIWILLVNLLRKGYFPWLLRKPEN